jgi:hypothetical protein
VKCEHKISNRQPTFATITAISVLLRGGYALGGVLPRYVRLLLEADQTVGRQAAGLRPETADFSLLPPRFDAPLGNVLHDLHIENVGSILVDSNKYPDAFLQNVVPFLAAVLIQNRQWIVSELPEHSILRSRIWPHIENLATRVLPPTQGFCEVTRYHQYTNVPPIYHQYTNDIPQIYQQYTTNIQTIYHQYITTNISPPIYRQSR